MRKAGPSSVSNNLTEGESSTTAVFHRQMGHKALTSASGFRRTSWPNHPSIKVSRLVIAACIDRVYFSMFWSPFLWPCSTKSSFWRLQILEVPRNPSEEIRDLRSREREGGDPRAAWFSHLRWLIWDLGVYSLSTCDLRAVEHTTVDSELDYLW